MSIEDSRRRDTWHVDEDDLRAYARGELAAPALWSADAHLTACAACRGVLAEVSDAAALDTAWERLDAELDAPRPGRIEGLLVRCGVGDGTARLLTATPILRRSWFGAIAAVLLMTFFVAFTAGAADKPTLFLAFAPLLPLASVALAYGPALDPTYEMAVVSPMHGFRLLMIRTVAVLVVALGVGAVAGLALPGFGPAALAWLLPGLALTATALALTPRLGPVIAPSVLVCVWAAVLLAADAARTAEDGPLAPFTAAGQGVSGLVAVLGAGLLYVFRDRFDVLPRGAA
ncbi:zf-HC2 domain-containing protein [Streptomyces sp. BBFR51]|uniref:zf-HC2 domain-containing protein n=1 Tax=Streptomyces sp. BBFR51 TaxID=3372856 RepID=UPI0037DC5BEE